MRGCQVVVVGVCSVGWGIGAGAVVAWSGFLGGFHCVRYRDCLLIRLQLWWGGILRVYWLIPVVTAGEVPAAACRAFSTPWV